MKGRPSSSVANYRLISITSTLSKVFERQVSVRFGRFMACNCVLQTTQFAYRKGLGTCDALLSVSHTLQSALESGQDAGIVLIDFSAAFDRVNHQAILCRLSSVANYRFCVVYTDTVSVRPVTARYGVWYRSTLVDAVSGVPQGIVLGQLLLLLFTSAHFFILVSKLIGYVDDSTLMDVVTFPDVRVTVAESLIRDLGRVVSGVTFGELN